MRRPLRVPFALLWSCAATGAFAQTQFEVLVNSRGTNAVHRYSLDGTFLGEFIEQGAGGLFGPEDILFHPDGSVLVTGFRQYDHQAL
ncbi:MAG: hypothetical protein IPL52_05445 [Flavobacteriales bacterium]|nr:hypothetical protein [Flavobacteriales bacterium]